jgi:hypothetical protein
MTHRVVVFASTGCACSNPRSRYFLVFQRRVHQSAPFSFLYHHSKAIGIFNGFVEPLTRLREQSLDTRIGAKTRPIMVTLSPPCGKSSLLGIAYHKIHHPVTWQRKWELTHNFDPFTGGGPRPTWQAAQLQLLLFSRADVEMKQEELYGGSVVNRTGLQASWLVGVLCATKSITDWHLQNVVH